MAKQIEITTSGNTFSFPTPQIRVVELSSGSFIDFEGRNFNTASTVAEVVALANTGGTEQVQATIVRVGGGIQTASLQMSFPASNITIDDSTLSGSNSVIVFKGINYYATETKDALVTAANASSGGTATLQEVLDVGSTLTKGNTVGMGNFDLTIQAGDGTYTGEEAEIYVRKDVANMYAQTDANTSTGLQVKPNGAYIQTNGEPTPKKVATVDYLVYKAVFTGAFDNPTVTTLGSNTVGAIVWQNIGLGLIKGVLTGGFPQGKTIMFFNKQQQPGYNILFYWFSSNEVRLENTDGEDSNFNPQLDIIIEVHP